MSRASVVTLGTAIGALDGYAASEDAEAGRSWQSTGVGIGGTPVLKWGWAPGVQIGSAVVGAAALATGKEWGRVPLIMGLGLMARAATLSVAQGRQKTPSRVSGYSAGCTSCSGH